MYTFTGDTGVGLSSDAEGMRVHGPAVDPEGVPRRRQGLEKSSPVPLWSMGLHHNKQENHKDL